MRCRFGCGAKTLTFCEQPISAHLDTCCKTYPKFSIFPFFKMQNDNVSARLSKEEYFIKIYKPKLNFK